MEHTGEHEASAADLDKDEAKEKRFREVTGYVLSIAGSVAAFIAGFGILPTETVAERVLILLTVLGISDAIIFGIGAWRSIRRFSFMAMGTGVAFVSLASLSVAAQHHVTTPQAHGARSPVSVANTQPPSNGSHNSQTPSPATSGSSGTGNAAAPPSGYVLRYRNQQFALPGGGCQYSEDSFVTFGWQQPQVTAASPGFPATYDMVTDCIGPPVNISFEGQAAVVYKTPDAAACDTAIKRYPVAGGVPFSQLHVGTQVCMINNSGNELVLVTLRALSDTTYDTTWAATVWSMPGSS